MTDAQKRPFASPVREILRERLSELRTVLDRMEEETRILAEEDGSDWYISDHEYLVDILWEEMLDPAIDRGDDDLVVRCLGAVDEMLAGPDRQLRDSVHHFLLRRLQDSSTKSVPLSRWVSSRPEFRG